MIATCSAMPTAVITESSENTMSSSRICTMTPPNDAAAFAAAVPFLAFELVVDLVRALGDRNRPPTSRIRSRPVMLVAEQR